ncbi:uncharacterized protein [Equus caballus]|uniref:uncharacterized protein n=1 Tax=Equus caballus TaxID=9796 RepID=UPI0038B30C3C
MAWGRRQDSRPREQPLPRSGDRKCLGVSRDQEEGQCGRSRGNNKESDRRQAFGIQARNQALPLLGSMLSSGRHDAHWKRKALNSDLLSGEWRGQFHSDFDHVICFGWWDISKESKQRFDKGLHTGDLLSWISALGSSRCEEPRDERSSKEKEVQPHQLCSPPVHSCTFFIVGPSSCGTWDAASAWLDEQCHVRAQDSNQRNTGPLAAERANLTTRPRGQPLKNCS